MQVTVRLKNPPTDATVWQLVLCDWEITVAIHQVGGLATIDVAEPITFEIPDGVQFPLRVVSLAVSKWIDFYGTPALQHLYEIQSIHPYLWDWDKWDWGDEPDPSYREVFIPDYGSYYYNVATEQFESIAPEPTLIEITAPDSAAEGSVVPISTEVTNITADSCLFRVELYAVRDIYEVPAPDERIGSLEVVIGSGQSQVVSGTFIMPAWDATVLVMVYRFINYWDYDNLATKVVSVEAPVPEYKGSIARKELEYDETRSIIPVY